MTKNPGFGQGLEMAALKKGAGGAAGPIDVMRPGNGTPWEDRGSTGAIGAYFKTLIRSLFSPGLLLDHIRRPETTSDSDSFALISGAMWVIGIFIYHAYWLYFVLPTGTTAYEKDPDSTMYYWLTAVVSAALVAGGLFAWLKVGSKLYVALGGAELKGANPSLIRNCFNYTLGPSIFAIIPFYGWALAAIWIVFDLMAAGKRRLFLKSTSAIINVMLIFAIVFIITALVYFLFFGLLWDKMEMNGLVHRVIPKEIAHPVRSE